jgi:hypothetical protein
MSMRALIHPGSPCLRICEFTECPRIFPRHPLYASIGIAETRFKTREIAVIAPFSPYARADDASAAPV